MPFDSPYYLLPRNRMLQSCVTFQEIDDQTHSVTEEVAMPIIIEENKSMRSDSVMTSSGQDLPMTENESVVLKHSEID